MPLLDPEIRLAMEELRAERRRSARAEQQEWKRIDEQNAKEVADALEIRQAKRDARPPDYTPLTSASEFRPKFERGERYFIGSQLVGLELSDIDLSFTNLSQTDLSGAKLRNVVVNQSDLTDANLSGAELSNVKFKGGKLARLNLAASLLERCDFYASEGLAITFNKARITDCNFIRVNLKQTTLTEASLAGGTFRWCLFSASEFSTFSSIEATRFEAIEVTPKTFANCNLKSGQFESCNFDDYCFSGADLKGADFKKCKLRNVDFADTKIDGATFAESHFRPVDWAPVLDQLLWKDIILDGNDMSGLPLNGCTWRSVSARKTRFSDTSFASAEFIACDLSGAVFEKSNLSGTRWESTVVTNADFNGADLRGAHGLEFDANNIRGAQLSPKSKDQWTILRREYSGTRAAFHTLLLLAFFLPYLVKVAFWLQFDNAQEIDRRAAQMTQTIATAKGQSCPAPTGLLCGEKGC
ncbi:MAG: pentapeptide repeat-containing protein [Lysobacterales bacterium]